MPAQCELPADSTPLVGRQREAEVVRRLLARAEGHLLTLTGPGGVGKTRLALHVARSVVDLYPDGVVWVELASLSDPTLVLSTIARTLGVEESLSGDPQKALYSWLHNRRVLLVLDNVEHLLDAAPGIASLLPACPDLRILATSRAPLSIRGEQEYVVPPLELPSARSASSRSELEQAPSVELFVQRARRASSSFEITTANIVAVAEICRRLDGLPLALELVAARVRVLSPAELVARLDHLMPMLTGGPRDMPRRQQTMRAALDWSYELLHPVEQALLRRLSVFSGGWMLEAAEAVTASGEIPAGGVIDPLSGLVEQSLVVAEVNHEGGSRYRMLEPIRQYAAVRLAEFGDEAVWRGRHAAWCVQLAETAEEYVPGPEAGVWLGRLDPEYPNLRAALAWLDETDDAEMLLRLAGPLFKYWNARGYLGEARRWLGRGADASLHVSTTVRSKALLCAGWVAIAQSDLTAAASCLEKSYALAESNGNSLGMALALFGRGRVAQQQGAYDRAELLFNHALALFQAAEQPIWVGNVLLHLGLAVAQQADFERGTTLLHQALAIHREHGHVLGAGSALLFLGHVAVLEGDDTRAAERYQECLGALELPWNIAGVLEGIAGVEARQGDPEHAVRLFAAAGAYRDFIGAPLGPAQRSRHEHLIAATRVTIGEVRFTDAWAVGTGYSVDQALAEAAAGLATP